MNFDFVLKIINFLGNTFSDKTKTGVNGSLVGLEIKLAFISSLHILFKNRIKCNRIKKMNLLGVKRANSNGQLVLIICF